MEISKFRYKTEKTQIETNISHREFMKLSLEERRRILAEQTELMLTQYQQDKDLQ